VEYITALKDTPVPTLLIIGGLFLIVLGIATIEKPLTIQTKPSNQRTALIIGLILLVLGIGLYIVPVIAAANTQAGTPTPTATSTSLPMPTSAPTDTQMPTAMPTDTPMPAPSSTSTAMPTITPTNTSLPTPTTTLTPTRTPRPAVPTSAPTLPPSALCPGSTSAELIAQAWASDTANPAKTLACTQLIIDQWSSQADQQQAQRVNGGICNVTPDPSDAQAVEQFHAAYWAVNDVATAWYLRGRALRSQGRASEAQAAFGTVVSHYSCGYAWSPSQQLFWRVADAAH